jgi:hypothetical protein
MSSKLKKFVNQMDRFKTDHMQTALQGVKWALDELNRHPMIAKGLIVGLLGAGGVMVLEKMIGAFGALAGFLGGIKDIWSGGKGGGKGGLATALGKTGGAIPVYVTNWGGEPGKGSEMPGKRTAETASGTAMGKYLLQYGGTALAGIEALGVGAAATVGAIATAVVLSIIGNEVNRQKIGDQGMIDVMRQRPWQSSAAGNAMKNEINLNIQGIGPVRVSSDPTDMNTTINNRPNRGNFIGHR